MAKYCSSQITFLMSLIPSPMRVLWCDNLKTFAVDLSCLLTGIQRQEILNNYMDVLKDIGNFHNIEVEGPNLATLPA